MSERKELERRYTEDEARRGMVPEVANVGRRERLVNDSSGPAIAGNRPSIVTKHEVAQRGTASAAAPAKAEPSRRTDEANPPQTSGWGREDRENPASGLGAQQTGERQSQELPGQGRREGADETRGPKDQSRASSQNGARIADFEESGRSSR